MKAQQNRKLMRWSHLLDHDNAVSGSSQLFSHGEVCSFRKASMRLLALHELQAECLDADERVHLKQLVELAHLEEQD